MNRLHLVVILTPLLTVAAVLADPAAKSDSSEDTSAVETAAPDTGFHIFDQSLPNGGVITGTDFAYCLRPDSGWIMDRLREAYFGANSVFYEERFGPETVPVFIVSMTWYKDSIHTLDDVVSGYTQSFSDFYDDAQVEVCPSLPTASGDSAVVRYFTSPSYNYYEKAAFCDGPGLVIGVLMKSQYPGNFKESERSFANTVHSYLFLTRNVHIRYADSLLDSMAKWDSAARVRDSL